MHDGIHLVEIQLAAIMQTHHHRGAVLRLVADDKGTLFIERQMHSGALYSIQRHNALRQFAFQAPLIANVLHKLAGAQHFVFVHQLIAAGQHGLHAFRRQRHSRFRQSLFRNQNLSALRIDAIFQFFTIQHGDYLRNRDILLATVQRNIAVVAIPQHADNNGGCRNSRCRQ